MKHIIKSTVAILVALAFAAGVNAQQQYRDYNEVLVTNFVATVVGSGSTNSTLVLPALSVGNGQYTEIKITSLGTNVYFNVGAEATTNSPVISTWSWRILSVVGGPYRNPSLYMRGVGTGTVSVAVEAWKIVK